METDRAILWLKVTSFRLSKCIVCKEGHPSVDMSIFGVLTPLKQQDYAPSRLKIYIILTNFQT